MGSPDFRISSVRINAQRSANDSARLSTLVPESQDVSHTDQVSMTYFIACLPTTIPRQAMHRENSCVVPHYQTIPTHDMHLV